ncbi:MAG: uroporphyrinogen-III C-methyltransferase [Pseudomonas sp.]
MEPTEQSTNSGKDKNKGKTKDKLDQVPEQASSSVSATNSAPLDSEKPPQTAESTAALTSGATGAAATAPAAGAADKAQDSAEKKATPPPVQKPAPSPAVGGKQPPGGTPPKGPAPSQPGRGLSGLALIVALAALGLSAWHWYQSSSQDSGQAELDTRLEQLVATQRQAQQQLDARLEGLPSADEWRQMERLSADVQRSQQALSQRLDTLQGDARSDWKLAEAEYLLRLAGLRLLAAEDVSSAAALLRAVDSILKEQPDSGVFTVREQLAQYQAQLEGLPQIDRPGIFLRLAALREQVGRLVLLPVPAFDPDEVSVEEEYEDRMARRTRAERVLMRLERYVRVDFQRGKVIEPLLDEAEMQRVRRTLQLTMEQAQWAALRGEAGVFSSSLTMAEGILRQSFELDNPQVKAMLGQLAELEQQPIELSPPDLSPLQQGLAAYIQSRRSLNGNNGSGSSEGSESGESNANDGEASQ